MSICAHNLPWAVMDVMHTWFALPETQTSSFDGGQQSDPRAGDENYMKLFVM